MAKRPKSGSRIRHGSRKLIQRIFDGLDASASVPTSEIFQKVNKAAGSSVPEYSVRTALRTLVKRKILRQQRRGRELYFSRAGSEPTPRASRTPSARASAAPTLVEVDEAVVVAEPVALPSSPGGAVLPHKLAVGEALVLHVGEEHVEAVTNVHGKLVVEKHPRARR